MEFSYRFLLAGHPLKTVLQLLFVHLKYILFSAGVIINFYSVFKDCADSVFVDFFLFYWMRNGVFERFVKLGTVNGLVDE